MKTEKQIEVETEHAIQGLEMSLEKLGSDMLDQVDGLTTKQLRKALKASIEYIYSRQVTSVPEDSLSEREKKLLGGLAAIIDMGFVYQQHVLKQIQQEGEKNGEV